MMFTPPWTPEQHVRGREVRARLLSRPRVRRRSRSLPSLRGGPHASLAPATTGARLLVALTPGAGRLPRAARSAAGGCGRAAPAGAARAAGSASRRSAWSPCARAPGERLRALAARLRADPRVARVELERRAPRRAASPTTRRSARRDRARRPAGHAVSGGRARSGFPARVGRLARRGRDRRASSTPASTRPTPSWPAASRSRRPRRPDGAPAHRPTRSATARTSPRSPAARPTTASAWPAPGSAAGC